MIALLLRVFVSSLIVFVGKCQKSVSKSEGTTYFLLKDVVDGLCLGGTSFTRCDIKTLWYVSGKPGSYQIHHRLSDDDDEESCLDKVKCHVDVSPIQLGNCNHCGSKQWNIQGELSTGYILTQENKYCLTREGNDASTALCKEGYTPLSLQFISKSDIALMKSDISRFINAAYSNDLDTIKLYISKNKDIINARDYKNATALMDAANMGHINIVNYLTENGADVNLADSDGVTALMESSMNGHFSIVSALIQHNANVNQVANSGVSALWLASSKNHLNIVKCLLDHKADVDNTRSDGASALVIASTLSFLEIVEVLLKHGADVNQSNNEGFTALIAASEGGNVALVSKLLEYKAEVNVVSQEGFSPLIVASAHGHLDIVKLLVDRGADVDLPHPENVTAIMYASAGSHLDVVKYLISKGANVNLRHSLGGSAMTEAATTGNMSIIMALYEAGADPNIIDNEGSTALLLTLSQGNPEAVKFFIERGVDVNHVAPSGGTALMFAAAGGFYEASKLLIEAGANVNIAMEASAQYIDKVVADIAEGKEGVEPHKNGLTALMFAASEGHLDVVKLLIDEHADLLAVDDEGDSALIYALKGNFTSVATYLVEQGSNPSDTFEDDKGITHNILKDAVLYSNEDLAVALLEKGSDFNILSDDNIPLFIHAAYLGLTGVVKSMILKGADIFATAEDGMTALLVAASEGHVDVVKTLINSDPSTLLAKDVDGTNALMAACLSGHLNVVELLVKSGINLNEQNSDGHTALMFAYNSKNQVESLIEKYSNYFNKGEDASAAVVEEARKVHAQVVQFLIQSGADVNIQDNEGHLAIDFDFKKQDSPDTSTSSSSTNQKDL